MANIFVILLILSITGGGFTQENTQTSVAKSLTECYNTTEILNKDNQLPMTINTLLDLIRKVEFGPDKIDLSALSVAMLQRFRQDGIIKAVGVKEEKIDGVLMYSPNGRTNDKFRMVLKYMVPGNALRFPNDTLSLRERCTLHSMMSSAIEDWERGDEATVCSRLGKYRRRMSRAIKTVPDDVEVLDATLLEEKGNMKAKNPDVERIGQINLPKSDCPVETGVIYTKWGAVAVGPLLAGIAAGAQPDMHIKLKDITTDVQTDMELDNLWGATLAGDLAEAALYKNEEDDDNGGQIEVGAPGGWNSTEIPHWYFLQKKNQLHITDAEIRGGLDGMILGKLYRDELSSKAPYIRLSQILDKYYSTRGIDNKYKACSRRELFKETAPLEDMKAQTSAFAIALDKRVRLRLSLGESAIVKFAEEAATRLEEYIPSKLNDPNCLLDYVTNDDSAAFSNIFIVIDCQWPYKDIMDILNTLLNKLEINPYTSNYTIVNAYDGSIILNSTNVISDLYQINSTYYETLAKGVDIVKVIRQTEELAKELMTNERNQGMGGGKSMTALLIPNTDPTVTDYVVNRMKDFINVYTPDLRFYVLTQGNKDAYVNIVKDTTKDVIIYTPSDLSQINTLADRIKEVPRRFVNPKCGGDWKSAGDGNQQLTQYITPQTINFYRIHANYFFGEGSRAIKIKGLNTPSLTVCYSRKNFQPRANQTGTDNDDVTCKTITGEEYSISLNDACKDKPLIHDCLSLYFSVEAPEATDATKYSCNDAECRYVDDMKYVVTGENLVCQSSSNIIITNMLLIVTMLSAVILKMY